MRSILLRFFSAALAPWIILFSSATLVSAMGPEPAGSIPISPPTALLFDFSQPISDTFWQTLRAVFMRNNSPSHLIRPIVLIQADPRAGTSGWSEVVQIALRGNCSTGLDTGLNPGEGPLGWVYMVNGRIQPFIFVDCNQIVEALHSELRRGTFTEHQQLMACAISHVIAHELTHLATNNPGHQKTGIQKARLTAKELISDSGGKDAR